jgi:hypothetical protein
MEVEAVAGAAAVEHSQLSGTKRKEAEPRKKPSFKALGHMVVAMRRFAGERGCLRANEPALRDSLRRFRASCLPQTPSTPPTHMESAPPAAAAANWCAWQQSTACRPCLACRLPPQASRNPVLPLIGCRPCCRLHAQVSEDPEAAVVTSGEKGLDRPPSKSGRPSSPGTSQAATAAKLACLLIALHVSLVSLTSHFRILTALCSVAHTCVQCVRPVLQTCLRQSMLMVTAATSLISSSNRW